jgi:hypothetical protein
MEDIMSKTLSDIYNRVYQPIGWSIVGVCLMFAVWGAIDDLMIGCNYSAPRLILFFLIALSPLIVALIFFKPRKGVSL